MIAGLTLLAISLGLRRFVINRHIRGRLLLSASLFAVYAVAALALQRFPLSPEIEQQVRLIGPLLLALGLISFLVALTINPWRADHLPERFPNIVQDVIVVTLFAAAAALILRDRIFAMTAVGSVVIGFALQDTLGSLFAGLAIQVEKPFRVGDWVKMAGNTGIVSEVTWRTTKLRTKVGNLVVVPNSVVAKSIITNFSQPTHDTRLEVTVGVTYGAAPSLVKAVILRALHDVPAASRERDPEVLLNEFGDAVVVYRVLFWITDLRADDRAKDHVRSRIFYALRRAGISIQMDRAEADLVTPPLAVEPQALAAVTMFAALSDAQRAELLRIARPGMYAAGEAVVRQGDSGSSLFVVLQGQALVTLAGTEGHVARLSSGHVFGEMSLLTGEPRTATVTAETDCELLEIDVEPFRRLVLADANVLEKITAAAAARKAELEQYQGTHAVTMSTAEQSRSLLGRVRQFLRL